MAVHGSMDRAASFGRLARRLDDMTVVTYDRRGYAESCGLAPATTLDASAQDLAAVVGDEPSVVLGHSFGGLIAIRMAALCPGRVRALVCYEPPTPWQPWWPARPLPAEPASLAAETFLRRMIGDAAWERLPEPTQDQRRSEGPAVLADMANAGSARDPSPPPAALPIVIAYGERGQSHFRRGATALAAALPGAELSELAGAGHGAHLSHPDGLAGLVRHAVALGSAR
ncbi:MAG: alpha/beta hydrolase [Acidimicrobiales bacterium]|nr:alpha/beta hydrolase [Acidimicrobiales bacterium]